MAFISGIYFSDNENSNFAYNVFEVSEGFLSLIKSIHYNYKQTEKDFVKLYGSGKSFKAFNGCIIDYNNNAEFYTPGQCIGYYDDMYIYIFSADTDSRQCTLYKYNIQDLTITRIDIPSDAISISYGTLNRGVLPIYGKSKIIFYNSGNINIFDLSDATITKLNLEVMGGSSVQMFSNSSHRIYVNLEGRYIYEINIQEPSATLLKHPSNRLANAYILADNTHMVCTQTYGITQYIINITNNANNEKIFINNQWNYETCKTGQYTLAQFFIFSDLYSILSSDITMYELFDISRFDEKSGDFIATDVGAPISTAVMPNNDDSAPFIGDRIITNNGKFGNSTYVNFPLFQSMNKVAAMTLTTTMSTGYNSNDALSSKCNYLMEIEYNK